MVDHADLLRTRGYLPLVRHGDMGEPARMRSIAFLLLLAVVTLLFLPACAPRCIGVTANTTGANCTVKFDQCSDSHVYDFACENGKCTCSTDGKPSAIAPKATQCAPEPIAQAKQECAWGFKA